MCRQLALHYMPCGSSMNSPVAFLLRCPLACQLLSRTLPNSQRRSVCRSSGRRVLDKGGQKVAEEEQTRAAAYNERARIREAEEEPARKTRLEIRGRAAALRQDGETLLPRCPALADASASVGLLKTLDV